MKINYRINRIIMILAIISTVSIFAYRAIASPLPGAFLGSKVTVGDTANTYAIADTNYLQGGHMQVASHATMLAITRERRSVGMLVTVIDDDLVTGGNQTVTYRLVSNPTADGSGGTPTNTTDSNWVVVVPTMSGNGGKYLTTDGTNMSWGTINLTWSAISSTPTTLGGYGITDAIQNQTATDQSASLRVSGSGFFGTSVGIGTHTPSTSLDLEGDGSILAVGTQSAGVVVPNLGGGTRMMWIPSRSAFRAGTITTTDWNNSNVGTYSTAFGYDTTASGDYSIALGTGSIASGTESFASGFSTTASGLISTAFGNGTIANGSYSTAFGQSTQASSNAATAFGYQTLASSSLATAFGGQTTASGYSSTAFGLGSLAAGYSSVAAGIGTAAASYNSAAFGQYNVGGGNYNTWIPTDSLFEIGNGADASHVANAFTVLKNGKVGIGTAVPYAALDVEGDGSIIAVSSQTPTVAVPNLGAGTRMMWIPSVGAFRAGSVTGTAWNSVNVGTNSAAFGSDTTASGINAVAFGNGSVASNSNSAAFGYSTVASGDNSFASGAQPIASGDFSQAFGILTHSSAYNAFSLGSFNIGGGTAGSWIATDPLFEIGNGTALVHSDALMILKNGKVGVSTATPSAQLDVEGDGSILAVGTQTSAVTLPSLGAGTRLMWYPARGAFRAGGVTGTDWDNANIGAYSVAFGGDTTASGGGSAAFGQYTVASNYNTAAFGYGTFASGLYSASFGSASSAVGADTIAGGYATAAVGSESVAFGNNTIAGGTNSFAMGLLTRANGNASASFGTHGIASGDSSAVFNASTTAAGYASVAFGDTTIAATYGSAAFGSFNAGVGSSSSTWIGTDPVLEIGNGTGISSRSNALTVLKNGRVGINTATPSAQLDIEGDGSIISVSTQTPTVAVPNLGAGTRMMWIPSVGAFRAGSVGSTEWDSVNVGLNSVAFGNSARAFGVGSVAFGNTTNASADYATVFGFNNVASGQYATVFGQGNTGSGDYSTVFGQNSTAAGIGGFAAGLANHASGQYSNALGIANTASGYYSNAFGNSNTASGTFSTAFGVASTASGVGATVIGDNITALTYDSFTIGKYNIDNASGSANGWNATDPLFEIGNGLGVGSKSDALIVLKNGFTGINLAPGSPTPAYSLDVGNSTVSGVVARFTNSAGTCDINPLTSSLNCSSDMRLKKNITSLTDGAAWNFNNNISFNNLDVMDRLMALNPVNYNWNSEVDGAVKHPGFIAQEVQEVFPDLVATDPKTGLLSLSYTGLIPYTIAAIKEMNLNITSINDLTKTNTWRDSLVAWFADANNGIKSLVVHDQICVDDQCLNKADIHNLLQMEHQQSGGSSSPDPVPAPTPSDEGSTQTPEVTPPVTDSSQQSPEVTDPVVDPAPETQP